jgi:ribosomal protein S18 acetylase RimI-like enzyme
MSARAAPPGRRLPEPAAELINVDGHQLRIGPWRGSTEVAYLAHLSDGPVPTAEALATCVDAIARRGFTEVVTSAVAEPDVGPFVGAGFSERERLHLLAHDLTNLPPVPWRATRRARPADRAAVLAIDHRAFQPFWQLDEAGLADAVGATPTVRFRVTSGRSSGLTGYAVFGLAGRRGYLQRLAVDPSAAGKGLGSTLVVDGLRWLVRRGATSALVNTQETNERAYQLYLRLGFVPERYQLVVLSAPVPAPPR